MSRLLIYTRASSCPDQALVRRCLEEFKIKPIEIDISTQADAAQQLIELAGCLAVPTLVAADEHHDPIAPPLPMEPDRLVRNVDRGSIISEPTRDGLRAFLIRHGFLAS
jgi:glutaredoxin